MNLRSILAVSGAALAIAAAPQARAATYQLVFSGTLEQGVDTLSLFGGDVQAGDAVTVTYSYDPSLGGVRSGEAGAYDEIDTDYTFTPAAITGATLLLDNHSYTYTPDFQASVSVGLANFDLNTGSYDLDGASASGFSTNGANSAVNAMIGKGATLPTSLVFNSSFGASGIGYFDTAFDANNDSDNFIFSTSSVAVVAPAPEPSEWSLLILAVGASGLALRRRAWRRMAPGVLA